MSFDFTSEQEEMRQQLKKELQKELVTLRQMKTAADQYERHVNRLEGRLTMLNTFKAIYDRTSDIYDNSDFDSDWMSDSSEDSSSSSESDDSSSDESHTEKGDEADNEAEGSSEGDDTDTDVSDSNKSLDDTKDAKSEAPAKSETPTSKFLQDQEAWLMERHIQWAGGQNTWGSKKVMCRALDIRRVKDLQQGKSEGKGNTHLNVDHCKYDTEGYAFGRPFHALSLAYNRGHRHPEKDFKTWSYTKEARDILSYMETWYFPLSAEEKKKLHENAWSWDEMPDDHIELWNRAFFPDNREKE